MTAIAALTENFTGAAANTPVTTANTIFDTVSGTGTSSIINDPIDTGLRMMQVNTAATSKFHEMDFTAVETLWFTFDLDLDTPAAANTPILQGFATSAGTAAEKVFDLRNMAGARTLQLRNSTSVALWTSAPLAAGTKHRVWVYVKGGDTASARRLRVMIFSGGTYSTLSQDSGELTSNTTVAAIGHLRLGALVDSTAIYRFGRLRGDDSTGPTAEPTATVSLGPDQADIEPGTLVTLTANTTGGSGAVIFTQLSGPTVTLSGTGNTRTFFAPPYWPGGDPAPSGPTLTFRASYSSVTATVNIVPLVHARWRKTASGWQPVVAQRRTS